MKNNRWLQLLPVLASVLALTAVVVGDFSSVPIAGPAAVPQRELFNGKILFDAAFRAIRDNHYILRKPAARQAFTSEWEHKFDQSGKLNTEVGADQAVREMLASPLLDSDPQNAEDPPGRRFDYYQDKLAAEHDQQNEERPVAVVHSKELGDGITYIKVDNFEARTTTEQFFRAVGEAVKSGSKALILDLRNNLGGDINNAVDIAGSLIPEGHLLTIRWRNGDSIDTTEVRLTHEQIIEVENGQTAVQDRGSQLLVPSSMPIAVLVNRYSASGSELLAGALQANHRAIIIGQTTLGKSTGQLEVSLPFARSLLVTNLEFFPGGLRSHSTGIVPDIDVSTVGQELDVAVATLRKLLN